jgi:hypothetical protein
LNLEPVAAQHFLNFAMTVFYFFEHILGTKVTNILDEVKEGNMPEIDKGLRIKG